MARKRISGLGVLEGIGQGKHGLEHDALEEATGQIRGFFMESRQFVAEIGVVQPAVQGSPGLRRRGGRASALEDADASIGSADFCRAVRLDFPGLGPFRAIVRHRASVAGGGLGPVLTRIGSCDRRRQRGGRCQWDGPYAGPTVEAAYRLDRQLHVHQRPVLLGAVNVGVLVREELASNSLGLRW